MNPERPAPHNTDSPTRPTTGVVRFPGPASERAMRKPGGMPVDASLPAFLEWMISLGHVGVQIQEDLRMEHAEICEILEAPPLGKKKFGRALKAVGYQPFMADLERDGIRWRPMAINLSARRPELAVIASNVSQISSTATPAMTGIALSEAA